MFILEQGVLLHLFWTMKKSLSALFGKDLLNAARVVDRLDNLSFFSRPLVLTDIADPHLMDIYTAVISLSATKNMS